MPAGETAAKVVPKAGAKPVKASKPRATVAKPGDSVAQVGTRRPTESEMKHKDLEEALRLNQEARDASAKEKAAKEVAENEKKRKELPDATLAAETKRKLA